MDEKALLYIFAAAAGGFWLGRSTAKPEGADPAKTPELAEGDPRPEPLPPAPPAPPLGDAEPGTYADRWADFPYETEVYPPSADETRISPPTGPGYAAMARDCSIIAVPAGWWDRVGNRAEQLIQGGMNDAEALSNQLLAELLPDCWGSEQRAARSLELELMRRLEAILPDTSTPPPLPLPVRNPQRNRSRHAPGHARGRRPRARRSRSSIRR